MSARRIERFGLSALRMESMQQHWTWMETSYVVSNADCSQPSFSIIFSILEREKKNRERAGRFALPLPPSGTAPQALHSLFHRTKSHVSVFLKHYGNMQLHVSVTFPSCGNVQIQVYVIPSRFRNGNAKKWYGSAVTAATET